MIEWLYRTSKNRNKLPAAAVGATRRRAFEQLSAERTLQTSNSS
jgi:hypothetical protein